MTPWIRFLLPVVAVTALTGAAAEPARVNSTQLGPRPFYLVDELRPGRLKRELAACAASVRNYKPQDFSIGHRGAALQFPEHTAESYAAAARSGAGIIECDVTFTQDKALVCRHAQCDLHTTTNIVATELAQKCSVPPVVVDGVLQNASEIRCCTSDITAAEFKTLEGKMDAADRSATTIEGYLGGTAAFRTDLYATGGTLLTHAESIRLIRDLGRKFTPELKAPEVPMPFDGFTQEDYAKKMIDEYRAESVPASDVWPQSFDYADVVYWVRQQPDFGEQAVYLVSDTADPADDADGPINGPPDVIAENPPALRDFIAVRDDGVNIIAPPMPTLLATTHDGRIRPSAYARKARRAGLDIISWTTERSGRLVEDVLEGGGTFYYGTTLGAITSDGEILRTIDVLAQRVGIIGLFSDWPATTTFYANCKDIPGLE